MTDLSKKNEKKIIIAVIIVLSAVYLTLVWNNNVWMDEAFSASLVPTAYAGVIQRSMNDTLPPLYNIFLKTMTVVFGYTIPVMKITSVIPMIATLLLGGTTVRRRFGLRTAILFMLFVTFMPLMLWYGVEIRMYSLGFFFATVSGVYAYETVCDPSKKNMAVFTVSSVFAGYSHHFAFVTVAFAYLYLLLYYIFFDRRNIRNWFRILGGTFILYLPCLIVTLKQFSRVSGYFSMPDVDPAMFLQYALYPYTTGITLVSVLCMLVMAAALFIFAANRFSKRKEISKDIYAICCFSIYYGVLLFGTAISRIMSANVFVDRYLFFSTGLLWLFAAIILSERRRVFFASLAAVAVIGACTYYLEYKTEYGNSADEELEFLRANINDKDILFCIGGHEELENCIPFYTYVDEKTPDLTFVFPLEEAVKASADNGSTLWIAVLDGYEPSPEEARILQENGLVMTKKADFEFDRYKCALYKVTR